MSAVVVRSRFFAKWFLAKPLQPEAVSAEWQRRQALEDNNLVANPPQRQSSGSGRAGMELECGEAIWATILDGKYVVEIQRINHTSYLCLFEIEGRFLHVEPTNAWPHCVQTVGQTPCTFARLRSASCASLPMRFRRRYR
ncbi:MAG: hypothetical protein Q7T82_11205 [Armatimonadota bacterium]|nr:hypothetical protein [Armatimonadota bacterium]